MQTILAEKLLSYIINNNPELLVTLQPPHSVSGYIDEKITSIRPMMNELIAGGKPGYIVEETCLYELTKDLRPSRYNYIKEVFEEEFEQIFHQFRDSGILTYEIVNMIGQCQPVFSELGFSEDRTEDRKIRYAVIGVISDYLKR